MGREWEWVQWATSYYVVVVVLLTLFFGIGVGEDADFRSGLFLWVMKSVTFFCTVDLFVDEGELVVELFTTAFTGALDAFTLESQLADTDDTTVDVAVDNRDVKFRSS